MWKKGINFVFVGLILCGLLLGLARTVFFPKKINYYENRYANRAALPTPGTYADGTFQDQLEAALGDQTPFAERFKARYNDLSSKLTKALLKPVLESGRYYRIGDVQLFSDYLTYHTRDLQVLRPTLEERAANYNAIFAAHPDIEFFVCYIEKDTDINFETGERVYADDLLFSMLNLPENRMLKYEIPDFAAFSEYFYRTGHHWNYLGSYRAYRELLPLLGCTDTPLEPTATETLGEFSGSKAAGTGLDIFSEPFTVYRFAYPEMTVTRNGEPAGDYGRQDAVPGELALSYGAFYGGDDGEIIFDTGRTDRGNLLVIGESYDNAILKLLAPHFDRTYSVDLRYYRNYMGSDFSLSDYLRRNNITKVLLIGNVDYYISPDFALEN